MKSEELELFPFVITSGRNSNNCDIILIEIYIILIEIYIILIEIYKEGRKMPLHERGKIVLYQSSLQKMYRLLNVFVVCTECMCPVHNQCQPKVIYGTCYKQTCLIC